MDLTAYQIDAFTTKPFGGNPATVVLEADALTDEMMQKIASEMYLSETTFITTSGSTGADFGFRFFTQSEEIEMSGHAFLAACYALIIEGRVSLGDGVTKISVGTQMGIVDADIHFRSGAVRGAEGEGGGPDDSVEITGVNAGFLERIMIKQKIERFRESQVPLSEIAGILGIDEAEIKNTGLPLEIVSAGIEVLLVPVSDKDVLFSMHPDLTKLNLMNMKYGIKANHIFTLDGFSEDSITYSRDFIPSIGMWEDPASGTSSAGLGMYLLKHGAAGTGNFLMEQGNEENGLARILIEIDEAAEETGSIRVGGLAATSIMRNITIDGENIIIT